MLKNKFSGNMLRCSFFILLSLSLASRAQVVVTVPAYPNDLDSCTVIFDATKGNAGLANFSGPIYAHTGVITNLSTGPSDWKYVIAQWNQNTAKALMTPLGNNLYQLKLLPSIRAFYGVPQGEVIEELAFVFRNSDGSKTGREANGGDIFANVYRTVTSVTINEPKNRDLYLQSTEFIHVNAASPLADSMKLFINGSLSLAVAGHTLDQTIPANSFGANWVKRWVKVLAKNDTAAAADSFAYTVIPGPSIAPLPQGTVPGINYLDSATVILCLEAPGKATCFATGSFNGWQLDQAHYMNKTPDGDFFWIQVGGLQPGQEYIFQYFVDGNIRVGDPYCDKVSDPSDKYIDPETYPGLIPYPEGQTTGIASVLQTAQAPYQWSSTGFTPPARTDLVIYELLVRDFTQQHSFQSVIDTLDYLKRLGINAIELMPVMEFEGNSSWGYNTNYSFAVDKYYGPKNSLKQLIDAAHSKGIAVILDIVCNHHFGSSPLAMLYWDVQNQRPAPTNPWFNPIPRHPYNVGNDFNHDSPKTRAYMLRLIKYWLREYHADGYRFDLSKGFTQVNSYPDNVALWGQYDPNRVNILKLYADTIRSVNPSAYVILEHFADNSEEKVLANYNMMLWGNGNYNYNNASGGWTSSGMSDLSGGSYLARGWSQPNLVWYMESHDEQRQMFSDYSSANSSKPPYNPRDTATALQRAALCANFFFTLPGPKMIWEFGELGYDYSINYPSGTSASRLDPKPPRWDYNQVWGRKYLSNVYSSLINLKKNLELFRTSDYSIDLGGSSKRLALKKDTSEALVLGNFDVVAKQIVPNFTKTGRWYEFYSGDSLDVTDPSAPLSFSPGEYRLYTNFRLPKPFYTSVNEPGNGFLVSEIGIKPFPNPASGPVTFEIQLPRRERAVLSVTDIGGRPAGTIFEGQLEAGTTRISWESAIRQKAGIFIVKLQAETGTACCKLIIL
jgi:glycosidase